MAAVCWPFALPGEFLWRDMALLDHPALSPSAFGGGSLPARNAPQDGFLALVGGAWAARVLIFAAAASSALTAARWARSTVAAVSAMAVAVANPFVIERLLQGQWSLAVAAWLLPVIAWAGRRHSWVAWLAMWGASLTPTGGLFAVVTAAVTCRKRVALAGVVLCLPWAIPGMFNPAAPGDTAAAVAAFGPRAEDYVGTAGALLRLGGIWNAEAAIGFAVCGVIVAVIAVLGAWRVPARLSILAAIGLGGAIFFWLVPGALVWFIDHVPGAALLRDSGKLTMLALPLYVASLGALPNLPAALATVAAIVQLLPVPGRLAVLAPRDTRIDEQLVRAIDGRVAFFPERANLVEVPGGVAVDPYSKAVAMVESGELSVDGTVVDQASPQYRAALRAWKEHDMNQLTELGVGVVVVGGAIAAETNAPQPQVPWALTALWMACPLLAFAAIPRIARRSSPTRS
ncbi:hypothetical protein QP958_10465 [Corynebacterium marquesiae]|uniref:hypothetical protein n=1 Tax=Corynebacterium marquesiae TaxID=2913503 RepID=UPI00254E0AA1|nr:hypothetical protein [Corynebacterium marquesiae]MDK8455815.1 hypothetical protein [Corynebacterium marquesiae]MDK8725936.1 hypothetical protein [Corynebacterium marquesiae]MDK8771251.1 hypothetical protein [Corynebacterium marquesiae]